VLIIDKLLANGIGFVLGKVAQVVDAELNDEGALREQLLTASMRLELGEIDEAEYQETETSILEALREIEERKDGDRPRGALGAADVAGATVEVDAGEEPTPAEPAPARARARARGSRRPTRKKGRKR
jgi:hypothetical protein